MADRGEAFVREVDEELRKDQLLEFGQRYGVLLLVAAALALFGVGGFKWWQQNKISVAQQGGKDFETAVRLAADGKSDEALKAFAKLTASGNAGYGWLSRLRSAGGLAASGKPNEALAEYDALANDAKADSILREYAVLQSAMLRMDGADWTETQNRLSPLASSATSPWRSAAREALAVAAMKAGKGDEARKLLEQILGDNRAQPSIAERAQVLLGVLTDQEASKSEAKAQPAAAQPAPAKPPATEPGKAAGASPPAAGPKAKKD